MELGEKLRQARQEAGLSQRQLCGDVITRNMLSQIEHGTARPSMDTLKYLASRLGKSVSYFLEEDLDTGLPEAWRRLEKAEEALEQGKHRFAAELLEAVDVLPPDLYRKKLLLQSRLPGADPAALCGRLPSLDAELYLRATAAFQEKRWDRCGCLLEAMEHRDGGWHLLKGKLHMEQGNFARAAEYLLQTEETAQVCALLEQCYRELEDYRQAYFYAVKQKK